MVFIFLNYYSWSNYYVSETMLGLWRDIYKINQHGLCLEKSSQFKVGDLLVWKTVWLGRERKEFLKSGTKLSGSLPISLNEPWKEIVLKIKRPLLDPTKWGICSWVEDTYYIHKTSGCSSQKFANKKMYFIICSISLKNTQLMKETTSWHW